MALHSLVMVVEFEDFNIINFSLISDQNIIKGNRRKLLRRSLSFPEVLHEALKTTQDLLIKTELKEDGGQKREWAQDSTFTWAWSQEDGN